MPQTFLSSDKLASIDELRYLLVQLNTHKFMEWYQLSKNCKEHSFHFAFTFDNTIEFLQSIEIINPIDNGIVNLKQKIDFNVLNFDYELGFYLLEKIIALLNTNKALESIFSSNILSQHKDVIVVNLHKIPSEFSFMKVFLLHFKIVETYKQNPKTFTITDSFQQFFSRTILIKRTKLNTEKRQTKFFVSYSSKDEEYKNELKKHFKGVIDNGLMDYWDGKVILPGEHWNEEIKKKLEEAEVILLLISVDFMNSDYINDVELKRALEREAQGLVKIIPILVRTCDFESSPLNNRHSLPEGKLPIEEWVNKEKAYVNIVDGIKKIL